MKEEIKQQAIDVAADMLEQEFDTSHASEPIARRVMSVILPLLEEEATRRDADYRKNLDRSRWENDHIMEFAQHLVETIFTMVRYADSIGRRHGHCVDIPLDDRQVLHLKTLLTEWRRLGGKLPAPMEHMALQEQTLRDQVRMEDILSMTKSPTTIAELKDELRKNLDLS
jgi:hypothetical protein